MTIFNTHLNAGSNVTQHKQQMQTAVDFMNYYNKKYLRNPHDLVIASVLVGDFNFSPLKYFNTGIHELFPSSYPFFFAKKKKKKKKKNFKAN